MFITPGTTMCPEQATNMLLMCLKKLLRNITTIKKIEKRDVFYQKQKQLSKRKKWRITDQKIVTCGIHDGYL